MTQEYEITFTVRLDVDNPEPRATREILREHMDEVAYTMFSALMARMDEDEAADEAG